MIILSSTEKIEARTENGQDVNLALDNFQWLENKSLRQLLDLLPLLILLYALDGYYIHWLIKTEIMYFSGTLTTGLTLMAFLILMHLVPETLRSLWNLGNISEKLGENKKEEDNYVINRTSLEKEYITFIEEFQDLPNHRLSVLTGFIAAIIFTIWHYWQPADINWQPADIAILVLELFTFFIVGIMAWRVIIVGWEIRNLTGKFNLKAQLEHPDECGGLSSLGRLCLWNTIIWAIPGTFFGIWILIWPRFGPNYNFTNYFYILLFVTTIFGFLAFFWPLYSVHKILKLNHDVASRKLHGIGKLINQIEEELHQGDDLDSEEADKRTQLASLRKKYEVLQNYPTWPFNTKILRQLMLSEIVPLISLAGLGQSYQDMISNIVKIFMK